MANTAKFSTKTQNAKVEGTLTDNLIAEPVTPPVGLRAIGPRVTFHFISDAWSSENTYQMYDVVQEEGVSYVALQNVPTGVELTNTDYWFLWSEPNAQWAELLTTVQGYDQRISENTTAISDINNTKIPNINTQVTGLTQTVNNLKEPGIAVIIGDSFSNMGYAENQYWWYMVCNALGLTPKSYAVGGAGFVHQSSSSSTNRTFIDQINNANSDTSYDHTKVEYVFIMGGLNDCVTGAANVQSAIVTCLNTAKTYFPQAKVVLIGPNTYRTMQLGNPADNRPYSSAWLEYYMRNAINQCDVFFINTLFLYVGSSNMPSSEQGHPTIEMERNIASFVLSALIGGSYGISNGNSQFSVNNIANTTGDGPELNVSLQWYDNHPRLILVFNPTNVAVTPNITYHFETPFNLCANSNRSFQNIATIINTNTVGYAALLNGDGKTHPTIDVFIHESTNSSMYGNIDLVGY